MPLKNTMLNPSFTNGNMSEYYRKDFRSGNFSNGHVCDYRRLKTGTGCKFVAPGTLSFGSNYIQPQKTANSCLETISKVHSKWADYLSAENYNNKNELNNLKKFTSQITNFTNKVASECYEKSLLEDITFVKSVLNNIALNLDITPDAKKMEKLKKDYLAAISKNPELTEVAGNIKNSDICALLWKYAEIIENVSVSRYSGAQELFKSIEQALNDEKSNVTLKMRTKSIDSIFAKLCKFYSESEKSRNALLKMEPDAIIRDTTGARMIFDNPSEENILKLLTMLKNKNIRVSYFANYVTPGCKPYVSTEKLLEFYPKNVAVEEGTAGNIRGKKWFSTQEADNDYGISVPGFIHQPYSNYSSLHLNLELPDGSTSELQIRGKAVHEIAQAEHVIYDVKRGKCSGNPIFGKVINAYKKLKAANKKFNINSENISSDTRNLIKAFIDEKRFIAEYIQLKTPEEIALIRDDISVSPLDIYTQYLKSCYKTARLSEMSADISGNVNKSASYPFFNPEFEGIGLTAEDFEQLTCENLKKLAQEYEKKNEQSFLKQISRIVNYWFKNALF